MVKFASKKTATAQKQYDQALAKLKAAHSKLNKVRQEEEAKVAQHLGDKIMKDYHLESQELIDQWLEKIVIVLPPESFVKNEAEPAESVQTAEDSQADSTSSKAVQNY
ncbi:hypothetical protein [Limosilactobacillus mucosae]|uniref:hypothetical protein n=1 Tax=Limosilactobacillus mucosae TaxID=97478 RepID=UPI000652709B|nr:hypothetical protein [Limosilactobacillus mucosae]